MNERIKALRKKLKMSQDIFAEKLGLTKNYISLIENGNRSLSRQSIKVLCSMFNVNEDWLQNGTGNMFKSETYTSYNANQIINGPINERIKELRHTLKLTQQEFADKIGIKRGAIANYEIGRNTPINSVVSLICREFNVNENWLRNGSGNMFLPRDNSNSDMCIDSTFLKLLSMLDDEQLNYIKGIVLGTLIADNKVTLEDLCNFKQR